MDYKFKTPPYKHQLDALEKSWNKDTFAYFMEMGTGKTKVLIDNLSILYDKGKINGALIVAPKGVIGTWYNQEIPNHLADHVNHKSVLWQANINQKQQDKLDTLFETGEDLHILIMNVEALSSEKGTRFATKFLNCHKTLMAIDESTTIKNPKAKRTKNIIALSKLAKYRRILTGSPVTKNPLDLYSQCEFLSPWLLNFASYYSFRNRYAEMKQVNVAGRTIQLVAGFKNLGELSDSVKAFSYRVLKEDCLDLPEKTYIEREVELTNEQLQTYSTMKAAALASLKGKRATAPHVLTQLMRLHQITCGHLKNDDETITELKSNRMTSLLQLLEEVDGKAIIWANYVHDIKQIITAIEDKFGDDSIVAYYGKITAEERQRNIEKFQNNPKCRFFVGNPQTGGYGITLTAANTVIYYSNGYDLEKRLQSEDRAHRIGQKKAVTYVDLITPKTVDEKIRKALRKKINIATEIMGEELREWI